MDVALLAVITGGVLLVGSGLPSPGSADVNVTDVMVTDGLADEEGSAIEEG